MKRTVRTPAPQPAPVSNAPASPPAPKILSRRATERAPWLIVLPLLALLGAATTRLYHEARSPGRTPDQLGQLSRTEAATLANSLCARLTGGPPCQTLDVSARSTPTTPTSPPKREWDVLCRTASGTHCSLELNADTKALLVFRRETATASLAEAAALRGDEDTVTATVSIAKGAAREWYARHYLILAGLPLPAGFRRLPSSSETMVNFEVQGAANGGKSRLLQVRIDPKDGSLEFLLNRPFRPLRPSASSRLEVPATTAKGAGYQNPWHNQTARNPASATSEGVAVNR
jgi:hypothetical protein